MSAKQTPAPPTTSTVTLPDLRARLEGSGAQREITSEQLRAEIIARYPTLTHLSQAQVNALAQQLDPDALARLAEGHVQPEVYAACMAMTQWVDYTIGYSARDRAPLDEALIERARKRLDRRSIWLPGWLTAYLGAHPKATRPLSSPSVRRGEDGMIERLPTADAETLARAPWVLMGAPSFWHIQRANDMSRNAVTQAKLPALQFTSKETFSMHEALMRAARYNAALGLPPLRKVSRLLPEEAQANVAWQADIGPDHGPDHGSDHRSGDEADGEAEEQEEQASLHWPWPTPPYGAAAVYAVPLRVPVCSEPSCDTRIWTHRNTQLTSKSTGHKDARGAYIYETQISLSADSITPLGICVQAEQQLRPLDGPYRWLTPLPSDGDQVDTFRRADTHKPYTPSMANGALHVCVACHKIVCSEHVVRVETPHALVERALTRALAHGEALAMTAGGGYLYALYESAIAQARGYHVNREKLFQMATANGSKTSATVIDATYQAPSAFVAPLCMTCALAINADQLAMVNLAALLLERPLVGRPGATHLPLDAR